MESSESSGGTFKVKANAPVDYVSRGDLIRAQRDKVADDSLWASDFVNYSGEYYTLKDAKLYTKPKGRIPIYVAANGPQAASLIGRYANGYATVDH